MRFSRLRGDRVTRRSGQRPRRLQMGQNEAESTEAATTLAMQCSGRAGSLRSSSTKSRRGERKGVLPLVAVSRRVGLARLRGRQGNKRIRLFLCGGEGYRPTREEVSVRGCVWSQRASLNFVVWKARCCQHHKPVRTTRRARRKQGTCVGEQCRRCKSNRRSQEGKESECLCILFRALGCTASPWVPWVRGRGREGGRWEWWRWNGMVCDSCGSGPRQRPDLLGTITDTGPSVFRGG